MNGHSVCQRQEYDVIIAGGGTAGSVVATRLAETTDLNILLLEAGGNHNEDPRIKIPAMFAHALGDPAIDWKYRTVPQPELNGRELMQARGKGLGGSSLINLLGLVHPSKAGFDAWAEIGNDGWDWDSVSPYLRKFQTFHMPDEKIVEDLGLQNIDMKAQGTDGPIQASYQSAPHAIDKAWVQTFKNMGHGMSADTMSGQNIGGYQITSSIDPVKRERSHAGQAYLDRVRDKPNLEILTNVLVDKVVFSGSNPPKASGVRFVRDEQVSTATASREVILCSSVFGTSAILERSGIGSPELLRSLKIEPLVDNENVGQNLQDHIMCSASFEAKDGIETLDQFRDMAYVQKAMAAYKSNRSGPLADACVSFAYMPLLDEDSQNPTKFQSLIDKYLDPELQSSNMSPAHKTSLKFTRKVLEDSNEASANICFLKGQVHGNLCEAKDIFAFTEPENYLSIVTALAHPLSRGSVHCTSADPEVAPRIDPAYFSHPLDGELMSRHLQIFDKIVKTEPLKSMLKPGGKRIPEWTSFDTLQNTDRLMRHSSLSNQHPCGTCAMLPREKGGVVDARLRVYGVDGLRICDASIMPIIPRCNLQSTVYAIGEKGAYMFREDLLQKSF